MMRFLRVWLAKKIAPGTLNFHNGRFVSASHWGNMEIVQTYDEDET